VVSFFQPLLLVLFSKAIKTGEVSEGFYRFDYRKSVRIRGGIFYSDWSNSDPQDQAEEVNQGEATDSTSLLREPGAAEDFSVGSQEYIPFRPGGVDSSVSVAESE
jgi:hypothetical protein